MGLSLESDIDFNRWLLPCVHVRIKQIFSHYSFVFSIRYGFEQVSSISPIFVEFNFLGRSLNLHSSNLWQYETSGYSSLFLLLGTPAQFLSSMFLIISHLVQFSGKLLNTLQLLQHISSLLLFNVTNIKYTSNHCSLLL